MLNWLGELVKAKMDRAAQVGIDQTTAACVRGAKNRLYPGHGYQYGVLKRSVQMRPARKDILGWLGLWGSFDVEYAIYVELGTSPHWIGGPVKIGRGKAAEWRYIGMHPGTKPIPYLRGTADREYPMLAFRIKEALRKYA